MPTPTWQFQNTDLHNIYDAIVAGGGGGGSTLAGELLDGQVDPSNPFGFYPDNIDKLQSNTSAYYQLFDGTFDPNNLTGFYPLKFINIANSLQSIDGHTAAIEGSTIDINNLLQNTKKFGTASGRTLYHIDGSGYLNVTLAAAAMVAAVNALTDIIYIVDLKINNAAGGGNTFNYSVLYYKA